MNDYELGWRLRTDYIKVNTNLYYMQYKLIKKNYPKLAKRAAHHFDKIQAPSFLSKKVYYWKFINYFGLYYGTKLYDLFLPVWNLFRGNKNNNQNV